MDWKVKLEGDENTFLQLQQKYTAPNAAITRDGINWFLESSDFEPMSDHQEVKQLAHQIVQSILTATQANIVMGPIYRIHYDNSKTVFRD